VVNDLAELRKVTPFVGENKPIAMILNRG